MRPNTLPPHPPSRAAQAGMSLIELMIAMVIGMAATIIMMQMLLNSDTAKRKTVGGNDAQIGGTIALFNLERDVRSAGFGINSEKLLGCDVTFKTTKGAADVTLPLVPVSINRLDKVPKGDDNTDTLLVVYGTASESSDGDPLIAASSEAMYQVTTPGSFKANDGVVLQASARPSSACTLPLGRVDKTPATNDPAVTMLHGAAGMPAGSIAFNLGRLVARAYAVRDGNLTSCDYIEYDCGKADVNNSEIWVPVASNIVALRAQYGRDLADTTKKMTGKISAHDQKAADKFAGLAVQCVWARTVGVRIGLVARGTAYDKTLTDTSNKPLKQVAPPPPPTWSGALKTSDKDDPVGFDLSKSITGDDWRNYRYKAFETNVPLRNMIWQGDQDC